MDGWDIGELTGKVLEVDLSQNETSIYSLDEKYYRNFLGGRGLNQLLLFKNLDPDIPPLDPKNILLFGSGILVGSSAPGSIRLSVDTKNYFTDGIGSANAGGNFAQELKSAGFGNLLIRGKADSPVYLSIKDEKVEIRPAEHLWGEDVTKTTELIEKDNDHKGSVLCIGPAGENLVRGASILVDGSRVAAKCGVGSIMGSKNLKAIWVMGSKRVEVFDKQTYIELLKKTWDKVRNSKSAKSLSEFGTLSVSSKNEIGGVPLRHYQDGYIDPKDLEKIDKYSFKKYEQKRFSVKNCPIDCRAIYKVGSGEYEGTEGEAMQANTIQNFGFKLDIKCAPAIIKAHLLCNKLGLDMDTVAESIAWAFECYDKGIIDKKDTCGLELTWGNHEVLPELIVNIALRKDFGDILADGVKRASKKIGNGSEKFAMNMKGQDLYETIRMPKGYGIGAALSTRGGGHCSGSPLTEFSNGSMDAEVAKRIYGVKTADDPQTYDGKAKLVYFHECFHSVLNSLGVCFFSTIVNSPDLLNLDDLAELITAATGWDIDKSELIKIGDRIHTLERLFNHVHAGFDIEDDYPPTRFFTEEIKSGPYKGESLDKNKYLETLKNNYRYHGWDTRGIPQKDTLKRLGLDDFIELPSLL